MIPERLTIKQAEAAGYIVDTHCYPHLAYKGPRFNPTDKKDVYTELEAELLKMLHDSKMKS